MEEVSPEEQEVEDVVERYPESNPRDVGLRTVPSGYELPNDEQSDLQNL